MILGREVVVSSTTPGREHHQDGEHDQHSGADVLEVHTTDIRWRKGVLAYTVSEVDASKCQNQ